MAQRGTSNRTYTDTRKEGPLRGGRSVLAGGFEMSIQAVRVIHATAQVADGGPAGNAVAKVVASIDRPGDHFTVLRARDEWGEAAAGVAKDLGVRGAASADSLLREVTVSFAGARASVDTAAEAVASLMRQAGLRDQAMKLYGKGPELDGVLAALRGAGTAV